MPARTLHVRTGTLLLPVLFAALHACDGVPFPGRDRSIELDDGSVALPSGADLHEVRVAGPATRAPARAEEERERERGIDPARIEARAGDAVRFTTTDAFTHALVFDTAAMPPEQTRFLHATAQVAGPPLVARGAAWVVSLADAPPGRYPFRCVAHGERGVLDVVAPPRR